MTGNDRSLLTVVVGFIGIVLLFLIVLGFVGGDIFGQEVLSLSKFTGLNTAAGDQVIRPNEATVCNNADLSRNGIGSISKRYGYGLASSMAGTASDTGFVIDGIFPLYYHDGTKRLLLVAGVNSGSAPNVSLGGLNSDEIYKDSLTTQYAYVHQQGRWSLAMQRDVAYLCSDRGSGFLLNGDHVAEFPIRAPGEPLITVYDTASGLPGHLNGTYRYAFVRRKTPGSADSLLGMVTGEVTVDNGAVYLRYFAELPTDTLIDPDSVRIGVYRTAANPGLLSTGLYAYYTGIEVAPGGAANDTIPDTSLSTTDSIQLLDDRLIGRSWADSAVDTRYGAPTFVSWDGTGSTSCFTYSGDDSIMGLAYSCTFIDTIFNTESQLGPNFVVWRDSAYATKGITIGLPKHYGLDSNLMLNIYRAPIVSVGWDTTDLRYRDSTYYQTNNGGYWVIDKWQKVRMAADTSVGAYSLLKQVPITDTIFRDNIPVDSTEMPTVPRYTPRTPPFAFRGVMSHLNRVFGFRNNLLCYSQQDSLQNWSVFKFVEIDAPGDEITAIAPFRTGVRVYTNYQNFTVYGDYFSQVERVGDWGCIAPKSLQQADDGRFYLSARGVVFESDGQSLERTVVAGLVSTKLNNFDAMTMATKQDAVGAWLPDVGKYLLSIGDTTYVYDKRASDAMGEEVWCTWTNVEFDGGFIYSTNVSNQVVPGKTFYFWRDNSGWLYEYGASEYDYSATVPVVKWHSGRLLNDPGWYSSIISVGAQVRCDSVSDTILVSGDINALSAMYLDSLTLGYRGKDCEPDAKLYWNIWLRAGLDRSPGTWYFTGAIDRFDIYYNPRIERYQFR